MGLEGREKELVEGGTDRAGLGAQFGEELDLVAGEGVIGGEVLADEGDVGVVDAEVGAVRQNRGFEIAQLTQRRRYFMPICCSLSWRATE
jgi:hypothetical protein